VLAPRCRRLPVERMSLEGVTIAGSDRAEVPFSLAFAAAG
jgi:hypothetical protein